MIDKKTKEKARYPSIIQSLTPIIFLVIVLSINVWIFGDSGLEGSNQTILMLAATLAAIIALYLGNSWKDLLNSIQKNIYNTLPSIIILLIIGALSGIWLLSGIVPTMIFYGLKVLNPSIFLIATCIISATVSIATGSSWTTTATVGLALLGIGKALGFDNGIIAGAIISGAYFGDKMSPLSDTTNLAAATAEVDVFKHIKYMSITTFPAFGIALVLFLILGFTYTHQENDSEVLSRMTAIIDETFYISPILLIVPCIIFYLIIKKTPGIPVLIIGVILGIITALIFQSKAIDILLTNNSGNTYTIIMKSLYGYIEFDYQELRYLLGSKENLLKSDGMSGMLNVIWLILSAMMFGGIMDASNMLNRITSLILKGAKSAGSVIASTIGTSVFFNITTSDQYLSIVIPGRMYTKIYREKNLAPENLSRSLEDSGTVTSVLIPWNTCGAYHTGILNTPTLSYIPYCFFNIASLIIDIVYAYIGYKIKKLKS